MVASNTKSNRLVVILVVAFIVFALATVASIAVFLSDSNGALTVTTFSEHFLDVNGDGLIDFVIDADVVLNRGNQNFLGGQ